MYQTAKVSNQKGFIKFLEEILKIKLKDQILKVIL